MKFLNPFTYQFRYLRSSEHHARAICPAASLAVGICPSVQRLGTRSAAHPCVEQGDIPSHALALYFWRDSTAHEVDFVVKAPLGL